MTALNKSSEQVQLHRLRELSARLGHNPLLVQASSGNTSVKLDGVLWIKASGKWLRDAEADDFLVPVCLEQARAHVLPQSTGNLRASSETAMHALLPYNVVVHVHSVNAVAWALGASPPPELSRRLSGIRWQWVPYAGSGIPLANEVACVLARFPHTDVLVLANHGLVVCGETCDATERLLREVEKRLAIQPRLVSDRHPCSQGSRAAQSEWRLPACPAVHCLAIDGPARRILSGGVLYPCQAIFLPETVPELAASMNGERTILLTQDEGVLCSQHLSEAEEEMLMGLANVVSRVDPTLPLRYLTRSEVEEAMNAGADHYLA